MSNTTYLAAYYQDLPYGYDLFKYDKQVNQDQLVSMLKQFDAIQMLDEFIVVFWHTPKDTSIVLNALHDRGFTNTEHLFWHKTDHSSVQSSCRYVRSVEMATIAFHPNIKSFPEYLAADPKERHYFIDTPTVKKHCLLVSYSISSMNFY